VSCFGAGVERSASGLIGRRVASIVPSSRRLDSLDAGQLLGVRHQADGPHKAVRYVHDERRDGLVIGGDDEPISPLTCARWTRTSPDGSDPTDSRNLAVCSSTVMATRNRATFSGPRTGRR
jgi:hypothetical protein